MRFFSTISARVSRSGGPVAMGKDTEKGNFEVTGEDTGIGPRRGVMLSFEVVQDDRRDGYAFRLEKAPGEEV